jgi:LysM repeat protein
MKNLMFLFALALPFVGQAQQPRVAGKDDSRILYIERYKMIAVKEMDRTRIPASVKLALGILSSDAGRSPLAREANNHFRIKCGMDWSGKAYYLDAGDMDATGKSVKSCFRVYADGESSFVGQSEFLLDPRKTARYGSLFALGNQNYIGWANGLHQAGYSQNPNFPTEIINIIEDYQLNKYDLLTPYQATADQQTAMLNPKGLTIINELKMIYSQPGQTLEQIAGKYDVKVDKLLKNNEQLPEDPAKVLPEGTKVFLQGKNGYFYGKQKYHTVKPFETMYDISQMYGIRLKRLYSKNNMTAGTQPAVNEKITLRKGWFERVPMPVLRDTAGEWMLKNVPNASPANPHGDMITGRPNTTNNGQPNGGAPGSYNPTPDPINGGTVVYGNGGYQVQPGSVGTPVQNNGGYSQGSSDPYNNGSYASSPTTAPSSSATYDPNPPRRTAPPSGMPSSPLDSKSPTSTKPAGKPAATTGGTSVTTPYGTFHVVAQGETLWRISRTYNTSVDAIVKLNNLKNNIIGPGMKLRVK